MVKDFRNTERIWELSVSRELRLTVAVVAGLLGITEPTVRKREAPDGLVRLSGPGGAAYTPESVERVLRGLLVDAAAEQQRLIRGLDALGLATPQPEPTSEESSVREALEQERRGRALAEAKIDQLNADLRRANRAIRALRVDVDDPDLPTEPLPP
jgi:hypothetical protein